MGNSLIEFVVALLLIVTSASRIQRSLPQKDHHFVLSLTFSVHQMRLKARELASTAARLDLEQTCSARLCKLPFKYMYFSCMCSHEPVDPSCVHETVKYIQEYWMEQSRN